MSTHSENLFALQTLHTNLQRQKFDFEVLVNFIQFKATNAAQTYTLGDPL